MRHTGGVRLFAALQPPVSVLAQVQSAVRPLRRLPGADRLRWTARPGWHITLAFFGEVPEDKRPALEARLFRAARRCPAFRLRLAGGGRFGDRVLWLGVAGARRTLVRLAGSVAAAARRERIRQEDRAYHPHLTLARSRGRTPVDLRAFVAALDGFAGAEWEVGELVLLRSRLPDSGVPGEQPRYERIAAWPLAGR